MNTPTSSSSASITESDDEQFYDAKSSDDDEETSDNVHLNKPARILDAFKHNDHLETLTQMSESVTSGVLSMSTSGSAMAMSTNSVTFSLGSHRDMTLIENQDLVSKASTSNANSSKTEDFLTTEMQSSSDKKEAEPLEQPKPPPRGRKKKNKSATSDENDDKFKEETSQKECTSKSQNPISSSSSSATLATTNFASLLEDIASIKGDLSVNEAILSNSGDRRSVYADDYHKSNECSNENSTTFKQKEPEVEPQSAPPPKDNEVLNQTTLLNIDTGERIPLSRADEVLPKNYVNPLSLHLMKLTNDYPSDETNSVTSGITNDNLLIHGYDEDEDADRNSGESRADKLKKKMKGLKKIGTGIMKGVKGVKAASERATFHVDLSSDGFPRFKIKMGHKKDIPDFEGLRQIQELYDCRGAIWCMKWSVCGQLLAVAGQDHLLRVYCCQKSWKYFTQLRNKASNQQVSPNSTRDRDNRSFSSQKSGSLSSQDARFESAASSFLSQSNAIEDNTLSEEGPLLLFSAYRGHTADVLDISWSKNHFLLSSSMDKTVRLWHITRIECLCTFRHIDFVTTIQFHPRDDRYFLSGSLDGKLRLWNIPDKRVTLWNEVALPTQKSSTESTPSNGLITSSAFVQNGKFAVIGTYDGRIIFFSTDQLKYFTQLNVSGANKNTSTSQSSGATNQDRRRRNKKVTGIEGVDDNKILVTTNDSRIRLYDLRDLSLTCKYRGCQNQSSQIKASISHDSKYIICGSENSSFYIWKLKSDNLSLGQRRDRNKHYECVRLLPQPQPVNSGLSSETQSQAMVTSKIVTSAIFAPVPGHVDETAKYVIAAADFNGYVRIFCK